MTNRVAVGKRMPRIDTPVMVTGKAVYAMDMKLPGMLHGKILRSPYPHARIKSIDTSKAEKFPGVRGVITAADVPGVGVFGREKVHYLGEKVAAVAADDPYIAEEALSLINVEYEVLPSVIDPLEAMNPIKVGAKKDGTITAIKAKAIWDAGAFGGGGSAGRLRGLYKVDSFSLEGYGVYIPTS